MLPSMLHVGRMVLDTEMLLLVGGWLGIRWRLARLETASVPGTALAAPAFDAASVGAVVGGKLLAVVLNPTLLTVPVVLLAGDVLTATGAALGAVAGLVVYGVCRRAPWSLWRGALLTFFPAAAIFVAWIFAASWATEGQWRWLAAAVLAGGAATLAWSSRRGPTPWRTVLVTAFGGSLSWLTLVTAPGAAMPWTTGVAVLAVVGTGVGVWMTSAPR